MHVIVISAMMTKIIIRKNKKQYTFFNMNQPLEF